ncbi:hypothetical protein AXX17_AT1G42610 [Arabidopsis thaliana]|uniref:Uncharacterized protein n=1 Tax=Arabidopsis thaliana TaxID=3702 RepID=A0A178WMR6_ARATH|nr:hypothetical protein AXX17_AT1G42610 [Arabidopsis thaliana]
MTKLVSKIFKRLISQSQYMSSSTTSNLPAASQTSNLESQLLSSAPPPAKKKRGSALLWYLVGFTTYGLGETYKFLQTQVVCDFHYIHFNYTCCSLIC